MDTAGLRPVQDAIEEEGVRRTQDRLARADLVIWVLDGSEPLSSEDLAILPQVCPQKAVVAVNKNDLPQRITLENLRWQLPEAPFIPISALFGLGIDSLKEAIRNLILNGKVDSSAEVILSNLRHKLAVEEAREALSQALRGLGNNLSWEFITLDLRQAVEALGTILGETAPEDVLDRIFEQFCIGK
jgi:tRNA modification GTPase